MRKEDNVCENAVPETERAAEAERGKGSAVLGKFRSVDALAEAYGALEAEFTRRSQRLKELEKQADNFHSALSADSLTAAEKPQKKEVGGEEKFLRAPDGKEKEIFETPSANCGKGKENSEVSSLSDEKTVAAPVPDTEGGKPAVPQTPPAKEREPDPFKAQANKGAEERASEERVSEERASEEDLYRAACNSEAVRLRIIGDYLASIRSADAPLMRGGTAVFTAPPVKAKSIAEAGTMALCYFKKEK